MCFFPKTCVLSRFYPSPSIHFRQMFNIIKQTRWTLFHSSSITCDHYLFPPNGTPVFLPGESQGRGSLVGCRLWGRTEADTTEATQQQQQKWNWNSCAVLYQNPFIRFKEISKRKILYSVQKIKKKISFFKGRDCQKWIWRLFTINLYGNSTEVTPH